MADWVCVGLRRTPRKELEGVAVENYGPMETLSLPSP